MLWYVLKGRDGNTEQNVNKGVTTFKVSRNTNEISSVEDFSNYFFIRNI